LEVKTDLLGIVCAGRKGYNNEVWGGKNCWKGEEVIIVKTMERWRLGRNKSWETRFVWTENNFIDEIAEREMVGGL
jgi:hypothetical protein